MTATLFESPAPSSPLELREEDHGSGAEEILSCCCARPEESCDREPQQCRREGAELTMEELCCAEEPWADEEFGATTAEYAILTLAAVAFAGVLAVVIKSGPVQELLTGIIEKALAG